ncbi:MAG: hypothetical protein Q4F09_05435 [Erysipelotrichaceae bacterium]|nr:hypothetical protein [Erysipelotrichaceae bacterium]
MKHFIGLALITSAWTLIMYAYLPVWQLITAFNVISIAVLITLETVGKELKDEIIEKLDL